MILTCPDCASRYMVDAARIGPQGRTVRCASCGHTWKAMAEAAEAPLDLTPAPAVEAEPAPAPEAAAEEAAPSPAAALPKKIRARAAQRQRTRKAAAAGVVWGALGATLAAACLCAALFRVDVVRLWPNAAGAYAKVGLTVNPTGLAPENVEATPGLQDGHAAVIVTGLVRNVETRTLPTVPLKVTLLDKSGHPLATQTASLSAAELHPGETHPFSLAFLDPPSESVGVEVVFDLGALQTARAKAAAHPPAHAAPAHGEDHAEASAAEAATLRGPHDPDLPPMATPASAEALPADSPYALPEAAHGQEEAHAEAPHAPTHGHDG